MKNNPLKQLAALGQSVWLDYIRRDLITSGDLKRLIQDDALSGITSNPSIFESAITESHEYDEGIRSLANKGMDHKSIYETLSWQDVQMAADEFRPVYEKTKAHDGYVSLEVNPHLAKDTMGTVEEARRLWKAVDRPNIFIKVPATAEGVPAIKQLISEGININVTLIFGLPRYREVAEAYITGIEMRLSQHKPVENIASVASFFLSRIDTLTDPMLEKRASENGQNAVVLRTMQGQIAIASAKVAYQMYKNIFYSSRFIDLTKLGAQRQRLLWASTSTKNPAYSDLKYIEPLIGKETINTMPPKTIDAYRDHGNPEIRIEQEIEKAYLTLHQFNQLGLNMDQVTHQLEIEGIEKFNKPFDKLMESLAKATLQHMA